MIGPRGQTQLSHRASQHVERLGVEVLVVVEAVIDQPGRSDLEALAGGERGA